MLMRYIGGLYGILGVPKTASQEEIRAAYKRLAHSLHPDKHLQDQVPTVHLHGLYQQFQLCWRICQIPCYQMLAPCVRGPSIQTVSSSWSKVQQRLPSLVCVQVDTTAAFIKCKLAYEILIDRQSRQQYDEQYLDAATQQVGLCDSTSLKHATCTADD